MNLSRANLTSAASTALDAVVPVNTTSGPLTLVTPNGTVVSSDDLFVPPGTYTGSDVAATARLTFGQTSNLTIGTAQKVSLAVFDGTTGQRISLKIVPGPSSTLFFYNPYQAQIQSHATGIGTTLLEPALLPMTGTYQFMVDPVVNGTGTTALTLYEVPPDITGTITAGGSSVTVTTTVRGQNGTLTFSGTQDDRISMNVSSGPNGTVTIRKPDGTTHASKTIGIFASLIDTTVLPVSGTYSVFVDYLQANTGSVTLTLYSVPPDVEDKITDAGAPVSVVLTTPGQNGRLTFSGTQDQRAGAERDADLQRNPRPAGHRPDDEQHHRHTTSGAIVWVGWSVSLLSQNSRMARVARRHYRDQGVEARKQVVVAGCAAAYVADDRMSLR